MKSIIIKIVFCAAVCVSMACRGAELTWLTDLPKAQAQAKAEKKSVLLFFHGSDWCPACIELRRQVIESTDFIDYAGRTLVLVDVDFPEKTQQKAELKRANAALKVKFNVGDNLPTLVLLNDAGETMFQETGYGGGGAAEVLQKLQRHAKPPSAKGDSAGFKNVEVDEFAKLVADKRNVILDVRTAAEFQSGHLAGAINLDVNAPDFANRAAGLDKSKTYLVHCAAGVRSAKACGELGQLGFPSLFNLSGGFRAWVRAGQPVEK